MLPLLDAPTLIFTAALIAPLIAGGNAFLWWQTREAALLPWAAGGLAMAASTALLLLAGGNDQGALVGSACLLLSHGLFLRGARLFRTTDRETARLDVGLVALPIFLLIGAAIAGQTRLALLVAEFGAGALALFCAHALLGGPDRRARASALFTSAILVAEALSLFASAALTIGGLAPDTVLAWFHAGGFVLLIGWNFGFLMLIGQRNQERIADLANHDELTGANTRRALFEKARHSFAIARRKRSPLSVLMLDIDFFKKVNDTYGHAAGDQVLRQFARIVESCLRSADMFGRVGGEEFCVVLPDTPIEGALSLAERIRAGFAEYTLIVAGKPVVTTVSIGVTCRDDQVSDLDALLAAADQALYRAKQEGRNRIHSSHAQTSAAPVVRLVWDGRYRSGHPDIDREHEYLFGWANALLERMQKSGHPNELQNDMKELLFWLDSHFRHEEAILAEVGWVGLSEHASEHRRLSQRGAELLADIEAGRRNHAELLDFLLLDVVARHLAGHDAAYFDCVRQRREQRPAA